MAGFSFVTGEPGRFASSPGVTRSFCARCGTSLTLYSEAFPGEIYVSICSLDDPEAWANARLSAMLSAMVSARLW